jgi:uncharacterized membrane protein YkvA (DUF1232 family)
MARERQEDREAGRPARGLFTGRGRAERASPEESDVRSRRAAVDQPLDDDLDTVGPRVGAKRSVLGAIRQIPDYVRLMLGLMRDSRVSRLDRLLVLAAAAYVVSPLDFIPDVIPFLGQVDDVFLIVIALQRLVENAGRRVITDHWRGDPDEVSEVNLLGLISAAGFFLPNGIRRKLRRMAGGKR